MSDDAHALLQFCAAKRELSAMDDSTSVERKKHARAASTFRGLLKDQLSSARAECVPIQYGDETRYAVLRPRARTTAVSCEAVLRAVRALRYDASSHASGATLEEWLDAAIRRALQGEANAPHSSSSSSGAPPPSLPLPPFSTPLSDLPPSSHPSSHAPSGAQGGACEAEEGGGRQMTLSILRKLPDGAPPPRPPHPSTASRIQETVNAMREASEAGAALRKRDEARRKELTLAAKQCEERVAAHLSSHDPDHGSRRVKLVPPGGGGGKGREAEASYHLRRTTSTRTTRPTVRTALPLVRQVVRALREESGVAEHASWEAYRWLTSPSTLAKLERQLSDGFASLSAKKTKARVVMTSL